MKAIAKHLWIISLILSLLLGGTLASAHSIDHLDDGVDHPIGDVTKSRLNHLLHADEDEEYECDLSLLASAQLLSSQSFDLQLTLEFSIQATPAGTSLPVQTSRLLPPSRAPPVFS